MDQIVSFNANTGNALTMSSREIAELTGSKHDNVLKTVRSLVAKGIVSGNETPYVHPQNGQTYREFRLDYRNTMVVVSGYSAELRAKIIDRWQELEAALAADVPGREKRAAVPIMTEKLRDAPAEHLLAWWDRIGETFGSHAVKKVFAPLCGTTAGSSGDPKPPYPEHWRERGQRLRAARHRKRLTLRMLEEQSGVCLQNISRFERGQRDMSLEQIGAIVSVLGVTPSDIIDGNVVLLSDRKDSG